MEIQNYGLTIRQTNEQIKTTQSTKTTENFLFTVALSLAFLKVCISLHWKSGSELQNSVGHTFQRQRKLDKVIVFYFIFSFVSLLFASVFCLFVFCHTRTTKE